MSFFAKLCRVASRRHTAGDVETPAGAGQALLDSCQQENLHDQERAAAQVTFRPAPPLPEPLAITGQTPPAQRKMLVPQDLVQAQEPGERHSEEEPTADADPIMAQPKARKTWQDLAHLLLEQEETAQSLAQAAQQECAQRWRMYREDEEQRAQEVMAGSAGLPAMLDEPKLSDEVTDDDSDATSTPRGSAVAADVDEEETANIIAGVAAVDNDGDAEVAGVAVDADEETTATADEEEEEEEADVAEDERRETTLEGRGERRPSKKPVVTDSSDEEGSAALFSLTAAAIATIAAVLA